MQRFVLADLYRLRRPSSPAVAPDGRRVAFVVRGWRSQEDRGYSDLWMVRTDGTGSPHRLTRVAENDASPAWSPDGRFLAFLSDRPDEPDRREERGKREDDAAGERGREIAQQIWVMDMQLGGEPRQVTCREEGVEEFSWSPDGQHIVFSSRDPDELQREYLRSIRGQKKRGGRGPHVIRRTQHKHDLAGYLDEVSTHLFIVHVFTGKMRILTRGSCDERSPQWSPDGRWISFISNRTGDPDNNRRFDIWAISPDGEQCLRVTRGDVDASHLRWTPDSRGLIFTSRSEPENPYLLNPLLSVQLEDAEPVDDLASWVGRGWSVIGGRVPDDPGGDPVQSARAYPIPEERTPATPVSEGLRLPIVGSPVWAEETRMVLPVADRGQTRLIETDLDGSTRVIYPPRDDMLTVSLGGIDGAGGVTVAGIENPEAGVDLFAFTRAEPEPIRLTALNEELLQERRTASYRRLQFNNSDGDEVEALLALPPDMSWEEGNPVPLIAKIHGGPMFYDAPGFSFSEQYWAGMGYAVLMVNYRGSISYGEEFTMAIRGDWGPREHDDLMCGVRAAADGGWADPERLFCTGFSYGGIMTNWAVGHTDAFSAAASEHGMWDYISGFGTDDCHLWWQDDLGVPWQNELQYRRVSPSSGVAGIDTPLLITAGEVDWRCPASQAEQLYLALNKRGIDTELVIYQGERHFISSPRGAADRIARISGWFARYGGLRFTDETGQGYPDQSSP